MIDFNEPIPIRRSWPEFAANQDRGIRDAIPREHVDDYDFKVLREHYSDTGVIHIEWDIAVDLVELEHFRQHTMLAPGHILIARYRLYPATTSSDRAVWAHHRCVAPFGFVYLPPNVLQGWRPCADDESMQRFNDTTLQHWLSAVVDRPHVLMDTDTHPVHNHW